jgi:hypothetical protein
VRVAVCQPTPCELPYVQPLHATFPGAKHTHIQYTHTYTVTCFQSRERHTRIQNLHVVYGAKQSLNVEGGAPRTVPVAVIKMRRSGCTHLCTHDTLQVIFFRHHCSTLICSTLIFN